MPGGKVLLVEGVNDKHVLIHLCTNLNILQPFKIKPKEGISNLLYTLPVEIKESGIEILGVIIDANSDMKARWQAIHNHLEEAGYQDIPALPDPAGTILEAPIDTTSLLPRVGIWIMPDNQSNGILEDFLLSLVPDDSILYQHVEKSIGSIPDEERRFSESAEPKAKIHTWLAWQENPGLRMGTAIDARAFILDDPRVERLMTWLKELFGDKP
jgi:hypothetical protein